MIKIYTKIQVIKMLKDQIPGMGLKEAKAVVDSYELKSFEDRVVRMMGEDARGELRSWAWLFVAKETKSFKYGGEKEFKPSNYGEVNVPDTVNNEPYGENYCCPDCDDNSY